MNHARPRLLALAALLPLATAAQSTLDTGSLRGRVVDAANQPLPGAIVRAKGPQGIRATESDARGNYNLPFLPPGSYELTVTLEGYSSQVQPGVQVAPQQITGQTFKLSAGSETVVVTAGTGVDLSATTVTTKVNLTQAIRDFAQPREFTAAFDFAPGAVANSGVGGGNYSIGGASGLENQYLVGGVNITNSGYGAIGSYEVTGATGEGTGLTTSFLENLDIRDGGFEAEYGGALGGVISATLKSGTNDFRGAVEIYHTPRAWAGDWRVLNRAGGYFNRRGTDATDLALEFSGPLIRDRLFFFVGYNPTWKREYHSYDIAQADLDKDMIYAPYANREYDLGNNRTDNHALRLGWAINERHRIDLTYFGSPSSRSGAIRHLGRRVTPTDDYGIPTADLVAGGVPVTAAGDGVQGSVKVRDTSVALKYFATLTPRLNIEASLSHHRNRVIVTPSAAADTMRFDDYRRLDVFNQQQAAAGYPGVPTPPIASPAIYTFGGLGGYQAGSNDENFNATFKVGYNINWAGAHELKIGVDYSRLKFREQIQYTGQGPVVFLSPLTPGGSIDTSVGHPDSYIQIRTGVSAAIRCFIDNDPAQTDLISACSSGTPYNQHYRVYRGSFNPPTPDTYNKELNFFVQDTWNIKTVTIKAGLRYTREEIGNPSNYTLRAVTGNPLIGNDGLPVGSRDENGNPISAPGEFIGKSHAFRGEWSPRLGASWDVRGNGRSKLYVNYSRLFERVPNDLAVRSFGNEFGVTNIRFDNPDMTGQSRVAFTTGGQATRVAPGTRLPYKDDFVAGYEFELAPQFTVDVRFNYRMQGRVLEDVQATPIEAIQNNYYGAGLFPGFGQGQFGEYILANVGENDQAFYNDLYGCPTRNTAPELCPRVAVTFGKPKNKYKAFSATLKRMPREGEHVTLFATYRHARITGNYEGLFRNDNGQSDPNITSLFDFPLTPLTRGQYQTGRLNTDIPHMLKVNVGYRDLFIKNLAGSLAFKWQSGTPRTPLLAHPIYGNGGEVPGIKPEYLMIDAVNNDGIPDTFVMTGYTDAARGSLGRNADTAIWDAKLAYTFNFGKSSLDVNLLVSNVFGDREVTKFSDEVEMEAAVLNPFFGMPEETHRPRTVRIGARWSF